MENTKCTVSLLVLALIFTSLSAGCKGTATAANNNLGGNNNAPDAGAISATRSMTNQRAAHTATLLPDGKVLIAGGFGGNESSLPSAEIFDPTNSAFTSAG